VQKWHSYLAGKGDELDSKVHVRSSWSTDLDLVPNVKRLIVMAIQAMLPKRQAAQRIVLQHYLDLLQVRPCAEDSPPDIGERRFIEQLIDWCSDADAALSDTSGDEFDVVNLDSMSHLDCTIPYNCYHLLARCEAPPPTEDPRLRPGLRHHRHIQWLHGVSGPPILTTIALSLHDAGVQCADDIAANLDRSTRHCGVHICDGTP